MAAINISEPGWLADTIASVLDLQVEERQEILNTLDSAARLDSLNIILEVVGNFFQADNTAGT